MVKNNENIKIKARHQYHSNKRKYRDWELKRLFGISIEDYDRMLAEQGGVCAICEKPELNRKSKTLSVDHNHKTGQVRGLLCSICNSALGYFKEDVKIIESAIAYLEGVGI